MDRERVKYQILTVMHGALMVNFWPDNFLFSMPPIARDAGYVVGTLCLLAILALWIDRRRRDSPQTS